MLWNGPAFKAGLTPHDTIVGINGLVWDAPRLRSAVTAARTGKDPIVLLIQNHDRFRTVSIDYHGGLRYPHLEKTSTGEAGLDRADYSKIGIPMRIDMIPVGDDPPNSLNVIIEVPVGGEPVKYEFDKKSGALFVDRILHTPMRYPANYGFVPHTLSPDGDPLDALVIARSPFIPGCVVRVRPIARAEARGRGRRRREAHLRAGRHDLPLLHRCRRALGSALDRARSRSSISSPIIRISSPRNGSGSASWGDAEEARQIVIEAIEAGKSSHAGMTIRTAWRWCAAIGIIAFPSPGCSAASPA